MSNPGTGPALGGAVDRMKGVAKKAAGAVLGDDDLKREGELHREKAQADTEAAKLQEKADREQAQAETAAREREIEIERQRLAAEAAAEQ